MDIRPKLFPYPVLAEYTDDYINSAFNLEVSLLQGRHDLSFTFTSILDNKEIEKMIDDDRFIYAMHIECGATCYRKLITFKDNIKKIIIKSSEVADTIKFCPFIIAKEDIKKYYNTCFNSDYANISFDLEKNNIVAVGKQSNVIIEKDYDDLANVPSIFCIIPDKDGLETIAYDLNNSTGRILIKIPQAEFLDYKLCAINQQAWPILHSMLIVPILVDIFELLKNDSSWEDYSEKRWHRNIVKALKKLDFDYNEESSKDFDAYKYAQLLLANSILKGITSIPTLGAVEEDE
jgi:hypothetical protein